MGDEPRDYLAYMLRMWRVETNAGPVWRASLESPHTDERRGFANLESLFAFLEEKTRESVRGTAKHPRDNQEAGKIRSQMND